MDVHSWHARNRPLECDVKWTFILCVLALYPAPTFAQQERMQPSWSVEAAEEAFSGRLADVSYFGDSLRIQLFSKDAVNVGILVPRSGSATRPANNAFFQNARNPACQMVANDPPFRVTFTRNDSEWITGTFAGMLGCKDYSALMIEGSFSVEGPGGTR